MKYFFIFLLLLCAGQISAQGIMSFEKKEITLKNLKADTEPATVTFTYKNTGNQPVIINRIVPLVPKMQAAWDKQPVPPGTSSKITVSFVPTDMPENFDYSITVFSNSQNPREQLRIAANIIDNPKRPDLLYKYDMGGLKFKTGSVSFENIHTNDIVKDTIYFFNMKDTDVSLSTKYAPTHLTCVYAPATVKPGKQGMIIVTFDSPKKNDYGYTYDNIILAVNNDNSYQNRLNVTANITEDFSKLSSKDLANAPVASFEKKTIDFGDIKPGDKANCDFVLKNNGKNNLIIRKTKASCGCTAVALGESTILPGKETTIRATFDSNGKSGRQYKSVTVITNDPANPEHVLTISGNIVNM